jgi:hypothetical protein
LENPTDRILDSFQEAYVEIFKVDALIGPGEFKLDIVSGNLEVVNGETPIVTQAVSIVTLVWVCRTLLEQRNLRAAVKARAKTCLSVRTRRHVAQIDVVVWVIVGERLVLNAFDSNRQRRIVQIVTLARCTFLSAAIVGIVVDQSCIVVSGSLSIARDCPANGVYLLVHPPDRCH